MKRVGHNTRTTQAESLPEEFRGIQVTVREVNMGSREFPYYVTAAGNSTDFSFWVRESEIS